MAFSLSDMLRWFTGGDKKEKPLFQTEKEAYEFCLQVYKSTGGVTPELRRAYDFYLANSHDGCEPFARPSRDPNFRLS
jgi:hypothetical protein